MLLGETKFVQDSQGLAGRYSDDFDNENFQTSFEGLSHRLEQLDSAIEPQ
jgi:hypothetical protein